MNQIGFSIQGPSRTILYLPDIDSWKEWPTNIEDLLTTVDVAYLDGTFFSGDELPERDMSQIPHPTVVESMHRFQPRPHAERTKVRFLHLNHSNPLLDASSRASQIVRSAGHHVAQQGEFGSL